MSDIIQLLPDSVANQIAAGEVIQRPASVVKELVENAIDAGATHINVLVVDAGRTSIQVIDNGKGMSETDARMSFERHATSKIRSASDLFSLHTMGFRGEALASIAAVAHVELKTCRPEDEIGTHLSVSGSRYDSQQPCSCPVGSNFMVDNLFYNVPARRKFLKSNSTELNNIITSFERIVLVNPSVSFSLHSNGTELFNLKPGGLRQRIVDVFGKKINQSLLPVDVDTTLCKIHGFVGKPESARKKGVHQYFFVNGRYMKHPYFHKAVMSAFERLVPAGEQVPYFLYFDVPAENIDVNIHPTKTEIKFDNEQAIWQILIAAVKDCVGMFNDVTAIDFDTQDRPDIPVFEDGGDLPMPKVQYNPSYNPFEDMSSPGKSRAPVGWEQLYDGLKPSYDDVAPGLFDETPDSDTVTPAPAAGEIAEKSPAHYQYKARYIMTAVKSGLMIIDQHRAHVRILYEKYLSLLHDNKSFPQKVLFPEVVHFSVSEDLVLRRIMPQMDSLGFELTDLGNGSYAINAVPSGIDGLNYVNLVRDMVGTASECPSGDIDEVSSTLAAGLARNAAVVYGQVLGNEEMESIINDLFVCSNFNYTPDGKKILSILKETEIEHLLS
ncbi:DNA mismatch repair endonuclease MutL [Prevotella sp. HCN-7019]|uniref:DNA mismatch repair endonuclease MutL n=1 Tax=Prevotella sp. HCN-7019 TaxID=3134668 RepID=UPI0030BF4D14